jgi:flagellar protein FlaG
MDSADKITQVNTRLMQPATPAAPVAKARNVEEAGKGDMQAVQAEQRGSVQQAAAQLQQLVRDKLQDVSREEVEQAADEISSFVQNIQRNLNFSVHDDTGKPVIKVTDRETDEVIRQIPTEEVLQLQRFINDASGVLFKAKV